MLTSRIEPVDSDGHLRSCLGFGVVDGGRRTRSYDRLAVPETKWKGSRAREGNGYKLCYSGSSNTRNNVGIILAGRLKDNVVRVTKRSDRIMAMSVVIDGETANFISVYTPRVGLSDAKKMRFWDAVDELVRECLTDQRLIIGGNLNRNIRVAVDEYTRVHGGFGFGYRNEEGCTILEFATAHDLVVANSYFKKSDAYLITNEATGRPRILWKNLKSKAVETFRATVVERLTALEEVMSASGADQMWNTFSRIMKDVVKESLGVANERSITHSTHMESWWFCEEVQTKVMFKQSRFKELLSCHEGDQEDIDLVKERYKVAKKEVKIAVANAKDKSYKGLYKKLDSKEGANDIYTISKARERRRMDRKCRAVGSSSPYMYYECYYSRINHGEMKTTLKKMGRNKAVGPNWILIKAWMSLEDEGPKKAYDSFRRELVWKTLIDKGTPRRYSRVIKDMFEGAKTRVRTTVGNTYFFSVEVGLHLGSIISPYLFNLILDELSRGIQKDIPWCMIFADDIVLIAESVKGLNNRLESWRKALEDNSLRVAIKPAMLYGSECWPITKAQATTVEVAELRMLSRQDEGRKVEMVWDVKGYQRMPRLEELNPDRYAVSIKWNTPF
nr:retrovirus-related Pol polyprotein LINE-1 [Tanacetum cinerariifolium]